MCKASQEAKQKMDAKQGETYGIGRAAGGLAAFHPVGTTAMECVACVESGETVTLSGIPLDIQMEHAIGATEVAKFHQTPHNVQDVLQVGEKSFPLSLFSNRGVKVQVGVSREATDWQHRSAPAEGQDLVAA